MKKLIVTGDDFGAATSVNEAIELAHRSGILTTTCLMMGGAVVNDAVFRAKRMPALKVGLHVAVVDGRPVLDPHSIPLLVNERGEFSRRLFRSGLSFFFNPEVRRQLAAEIRAQFEAFRATGLTLDHVNGHNHMHIHPSVLDLIIDIGRDFGVRAVRLPYEPFLPTWQATHTDLVGRFETGVLLLPMLGLMRHRLRRAQLAFNDYLFGISDTGGMTSERVLQLISHLPDGVSEMHFHPATGHWPGMQAQARCQEELAALTNVDVALAIEHRGIKMTTFGELGAA